MSLLRFLAALAAAGELDAATQPVIRPKLRNTGLAMLLGGVVAITASYITRGFNCAALLSVLLVAAGILVLLIYSLEAKQYGYIAIVLMLAFAAAGLGAVLYLRREARWTPTELAVPRHSRLTAVATSEEARPSISLPEKVEASEAAATSFSEVRKRPEPRVRRCISITVRA